LPDGNPTSRGFDGAIENRNESIARSFDQPSVVRHNAGLYEFALDPLNSIVRPVLIDLQ
jgi:hypothetical protein